MKASLQQYRQAPRKVRLVADLIRGKSVAEAKIELRSVGKRASLPILKLLQSAFANARRLTPGAQEADLIISEIRVDKGPVLKRFQPRARGSGAPIHKHTSHIKVALTSASAPKKL